MKNDNMVLVFVRLKAGDHCIPLFHNTPMWNVRWTNKERNVAVAETQGWQYIIQHDWLIAHPFLSCFTEIQLIKPK